MRKLNLLFFVALSSMCITACQGAGNSQNSAEPPSEPSSEPVVDDTVNVFVLSGQSNMEGSTTYDNGNDWLRKAFENLGMDIYPFEDSHGKVTKDAPGIPNVLTSYYGFYPPNGPKDAHASNETDKLAGKFMPTNVAMGSQERFMGPEIGLSYVLRDYATEEKPIYLIKCAFSGSGFNSNSPNWIHSTGMGGTYNADNNLYETYFEPFVRNNLDLISATGKIPVIRGFLWHQGETDSGNANYATQLGTLVNRFREEFGDYAVGGDGNNIGFIDGYIYDGPRSPYGADTDLVVNQQKDKLAQEHANNFVINTSYHHEDGQEKMQLNINPDRGDVEGGVDNYHYKTYDCVRLGMAYAEMIINNNLI